MDCGLFRNKIKSLAQDMLDAKRFGQDQEFLEDLNTLKFYIRKLKEESEETREDSAFFEGELEEKEAPKWSPAVQAYRERRQKRLDAKDEEGRWVTTEKDNKIHINEEGEVDKGNPFVVATANPVFRKAAKDADNAVEFWTNLTEAQQKVVGKNYKKIYEALKPSAGEKSEWAEPKGTKADMPVKIKKPEKPIQVVVSQKYGDDDHRTADADDEGVITLNPAQKETWSESVFFHEMGHQIAALGLDEDVAINPGGLWGRYNSKHRLIESPDGVTMNANPGENFADMYKEYRVRPEWLKEKAPDCYDYFEHLNKENPWLEQWVNDSLEEYKKAVKAHEQGAAKPSTVHKHDGSVIGNHVLDYQNPHVTAEDRDRVKKDVHTHIDTGRRERGFSDRRAFFGAGKYIADEVKARFKLRRKAKDDDIFDKPQTEDIYDVLKDIRPFGPPESFDKVKVKSDIDQERTDAIVKEAMSRFPTDWYEGIDYGTVTIFVHDSPGRACYAVGYDGSAAIHVFARENPVTVKDLNLQDDHISDCGIVNTLAHELGHYIEQRNYEVGSIMRRCLQDRTAKSTEEYLEPGYETKPDSFFTKYMGKQYYDGTTEILSVLMQRLGYSDPFEQLTGKSSMSDAKDNESLRFLLGILGGL